MTHVDFYVMTGGGVDQSILVACRLAEKACRQHDVYIHTSDEAQTNALNEKLWSFRPDAFVPHEIHSDHKHVSNAKVVIGHMPPPEAQQDVLINLSLSIPRFHGRFKRLLEVVPAEHSAREACRKNYSYYKERGYPLNKHDIAPT